jgi:hypothetical protein
VILHQHDCTRPARAAGGGGRPEHRALRGGNFNNTARNVRCANRNDNDPDNRNDNNGFRVVVSTLASCRNCPPERKLLRAEANGGVCPWPRPARVGPGE